MKNFDEGRLKRKATKEERTFVIHGETFVALPSVHPNVLIEYDSIEEDDKAEKILEAVDKLVVQMVEDTDDSAARWKAIRDDTVDPIDLDDLMDLVKWLMEVQSRRPTGQRSGSSPGPRTTETSSMDVSSSPEDMAVSRT